MNGTACQNLNSGLPYRSVASGAAAIGASHMEMVKRELLIAKIYTCVLLTLLQDVEWQEYCDQRDVTQQDPADGHRPHHQLLPAGGGDRQ